VKSLNTDKTSTQSLTVKNTGGSDLVLSIKVGAESAAAVASVKTISIPVKASASASSAQKQSASGKKKLWKRSELKLLVKQHLFPRYLSSLRIVMWTM